MTKTTTIIYVVENLRTGEAIRFTNNQEFTEYINHTKNKAKTEAEHKE